MQWSHDLKFAKYTISGVTKPDLSGVVSLRNFHDSLWCHYCPVVCLNPNLSTVVSIINKFS